MKFQELDVVRYDTGTTYMVGSNVTEQTVWASGWKDGKPRGAIRALDPARCTKIGKAVRPAERGDGWQFIPVSEDGGGK